jgi:hypothetical protein
MSSHHIEKDREQMRGICVSGLMKQLFSLLLLASFALSAGELTGKWSGSFTATTPSGETKEDSAYLVFKVEGANVTGTAGPNEEKQWAIKNGKLEAGKLTFKVEIDDGRSFTFDLVFDGDTVRGTSVGVDEDGTKISAKVDLKRM